MSTPQEFFQAGLSILPCDPINKRPRLKSWKPLSIKADPTITFTDKDSIAIVCGEVSGNIEVIDFDLKYDITGSLYSNYVDMINAHDETLINLLTIQKTQNNGYHFFYKCSTIGRNDKLASRPATIEEQRTGDKVKVLIETRGEGGYVLVHPSKGYSIVSGDLLNINTITPHQRELLFSCAKSFDETTELFTHPPFKELTKHTGLTPFDDYNKRGDCVALLQDHGWTIVRSQRSKVFLLRPGSTTAETSGNFDSERNAFSVFSTSTQFEPMKAYMPYAVYATLVHDGNFSRACAELYAQGYGDRHQPTPTTQGGYIDKFWSASIKKGTIKISFSYQLYRDWLHQQGYFRYCYAPNQYMYVNIQDNVLTQIYKKDLRKVVFDYILSLDLSRDIAKSDDIFEYIAQNEAKVFSDGILEMLDEKPITFCEDTRTNSYFFFKNQAVVVTKQGINRLQYSELKGVVWNTQIIDFSVNIEGSDTNDYKTFIRNVTANDPERFKSVCSVIGFLVHGYKDFSRCPAIILNDEIISDDPEGGTGKGLFISGIKQFKKTHIIDGKNFVMTKGFAFQSIDLDTKLIAFEDVTKNFNFERLFSIITEGITVEKKNKQEFFIPFEHAPKVVITTNYTVAGSGNSHDRRRFEVEFRQFYNKEHTPLKEFGRLLFHDWNKDDWGRFYRFMFSCVQLYLTENLVSTVSVNLPIKHIQNETSPEFVVFAGGLKRQYKYNKKALFEQFTSEFPDFQKLKQRTFTSWIARYAKYIEVELIDSKSGSDYYFSFGEEEDPNEIPF